VRLVPENLGEVHIKIAVKDGTLVAEIRASSEVTREILSRETHKIQAMLLDTGAKVEHVVVRTGGFGGEAFQSDRSNQRESNLPPDKEGGSHSGRDEKDTGSSHQEKERDPNSPWDRWEKFA
jgi:flagellar hook-length control protein FliK